MSPTAQEVEQARALLAAAGEHAPPVPTAVPAPAVSAPLRDPNYVDGMHFGPEPGSKRAIGRYPLSFAFERDGEAEVHRFQALEQFDVTGFAGLLTKAQAAGGGDEGDLAAVSAIFRVIAKGLDNKDGTPAQWKPVPLPRTADMADDQPDNFRAPDGKILPMPEAERYTAFDAGSSRRRWEHLAFEDDDLVADVNHLAKLMQGMISRAAGRPTRPSV